MDPSFVFGYGSLMERGTGVPCRLEGHRRRWGVAMDNRRTIPGYKYFLDPAGGRPEVFVAFLDAAPEPGAAVAGLAFEVSEAALEALDARERNYRRIDVTESVDADLGGRVWAYLGRDEARERLAAGQRTGTAVVARAYVDGVRAGFAAHGLAFDPEPELPVRDLTLVWVPWPTSTAAG
jgi:cation transport regulator ChaC